MSDTTGNDRGDGVSAGRRSRRKRRLWLWPVMVVLMLGMAAGVFVAVQDARTVSLGAISPAPDSLLGAGPLTVSCELVRFVPGRGTVVLVVDGETVPAADVSLRPGVMQARLALADGPHRVTVVYESNNLLGRHLDRTWSFRVDTTPPTIRVEAPRTFPRLAARSSEVTFALSEAAVVSLDLDGRELLGGTAKEAADVVRATIVSDEGRHTLGLTATDQAGNVTRQRWDLVVDYKAPALTAEGLPEADVWSKHNSASVALTVADHFSDELTVTATLDGSPLALREDVAAGSAGKRVFTLATGTLAEGTHNLAVSATDLGGHVTTLQRSFLVDTSSVFGTRTLTTGALGEDVKQLQRILKIKGVYTGDPTGLLDESTAAAVAAFNSRQGLAGGGVVTERTLRHLLGRIRIDLSERKLYLFDGDDQVSKTYRVAVGMAAHPTPTGDFRIITKEKNPTWNPPNSAWAAGMSAVPPGPGNPLGTRWMGLNSPGIGIHGTPAPSTIGTAASHGCIRMKIPEAEDLFGRVFVGTPVQIVR